MLVLLNILFKILNGILPVVGIFIFQTLLNEIIKYISLKNNLQTIIILFIIQLVLFIIPYAINHLLSINEQLITNRVTEVLTNRIFKKTSVIDFLNFENPDFFNTYQRVNGNQGSYINAFTALTSLMSSIISLVSSVTYLTTINFSVLIIVIIGIIPYFVIQLRFAKKNFNLLSDLVLTNRKREYISFLLSQRNVLKEIKIFNSFNFFIEKWQEHYKTYTIKQIGFTKTKAKYLFFSEIILVLTYGFSGILIILNLNSQTAAGDLLATLQSIQLLQSSLSMATLNYSSYKSSTFFIEDFIKFINMPITEATKKLTNTTDSFRLNKIRLDNFSFTYPSMLKNSIKNIHLEINYGEKIAIVGENGSGKSTLMKCILGLYSPLSTHITVNNTPFSELDLNQYQSRISVLFQDFSQYDLTVGENITLNSGNDIVKVNESLSKVDLLEVVNELPEKSLSLLGRQFTGGNELSGGQWQKLAFARALYRDSDLLILDEPSSALDPISEKKIFEELLNTYKGTILCVTHRLKVAELADKIFVLQDGRIVEEGTHSELLTNNGLYKRMYETQNNYQLIGG